MNHMKTIQKISPLIIFLLVTVTGTCGKVDTVSIFSNAMQRTYNAIVITPDNYTKKNTKFETVYLLHGHGGSYSNWIKRVPELKKYADTYQLIIVCPEGTVASWYFDSPITDSMRFETYIAMEVPAYIDSHYHTINDRKSRAITGLSMGGHGGLFLGFRHASDFGACGSMSGGLMIENIKTTQYGIPKILGDTSNIALYKKYSIMAEMETYPKDSIAIVMDCGTEDFIIGMSRAVHERMLALKISHTYTERPGKHEWKYWAEAVQYQLLFFRNYFDSKKTVSQK